MPWGWVPVAGGSMEPMTGYQWSKLADWIFMPVNSSEKMSSNFRFISLFSVYPRLFGYAKNSE